MSITDSPSFENYLTDSLQAANELYFSPQLAVPVAQSAVDGGVHVGDAAQGVAHASNLTSVQTAADRLSQHHGSNWFMSAVHWVGRQLTPSSTQAAVGGASVLGVNRSTLTPHASADASVQSAYDQAMQQATASGQPIQTAHFQATQAAQAVQKQFPMAADANGLHGLQSIANLPLQEIAHDYRYLRDVQSRHGTMAFLGEALGTIAGTIGGGFAGGFAGAPVQGAVLGAEAATSIEGRYAGYRDSWDATSNPKYTDPTGRAVNPGEDIARVINAGVQGAIGWQPLREGAAPQKVLSDVTGFLSTMALDPVAQGLSLRSALSQAGEVLASPADVQQLAAVSPKAQKFFDVLATKDAGTIATEYPPLSGLAADLGAATTRQGVVDVLSDAFAQHQLSTVPVPSFPTNMRYTPPPTPKEIAAEQGGQSNLNPLQTLGRKLTAKQLMTLDEDLAFQRDQIDLTKSDSTTINAYESLLKQGTAYSDRVVQGLKADFVGATYPQRMQMLQNTLVDNFLSKIPNPDASLVAEVRQHAADYMIGRDGEYGFNTKGINTSKVGDATDGGSRGAAIWTTQRGATSVPTQAQFNTAVNAQRGIVGLFGKVGDFSANYLMRPFKTMAVTTLGFAQRISLAEGIPAVLREGVGPMSTASIVASAVKHGAQDVLDQIAEEAKAGSGGTEYTADNIRAAVAASFRGSIAAKADPELLKLAIDNAVTMGTHQVPPALDASHSLSTYAGLEEANTQNMFKLAQKVPGPLHGTDVFEGKGAGDPNFPMYWRAALQHPAQDAMDIQGAAKAYLAEYLDAAKNPRSVRIASSDIPSSPLSVTPATRTLTGTEAALAAERSATEAAMVQQRAAITALKDSDPRLFDSLDRSNTATAEGLDPIEDWARTRVETMKGLTHSPDRSVADAVISAQTGVPTVTGPTSVAHVPILDALSKGKVPSLATLSAIPEVDRPYFVPGRVYAADQSGNILSRIINFGHERILGPIINNVARSNQYLLALQRAYDPSQLIENGGFKTADEVLNQAQRAATLDVAQFIHNPYDRTQFAETVRNFIPFYFAQEQSYRRMGRLLATDPAAFRRYQIMITGMSDYTQRVKDSTGTDQVVLPGMGWLDSSFMALAKKMGVPIVGSVPTQFLGNVSSLNTVLPFSENLSPVGVPYPSWSPFVSIPAHVVDALDPALTPAVSKVFGPSVNYSNNAWDLIIPNLALRGVMTSFGVGNQNAVNSAMISTLQRLAFQQTESDNKWAAEGKSYDDPARPKFIPSSDSVNAISTTSSEQRSTATKEWQDFIDRVKNQTRITMIAKSFLAAVSPLSPSVQIADANLANEYKQFVKKDGFSVGTANFLAKYPNALAYTIAKSTSPVAPLANAQNFFNDNAAFMKAYPNASSFFVPQDLKGTFDPTTYNEQIAMGLRRRKDLHQFAQDFYIAAGNHQFFEQDYKAHQAALAQIGNDPVAKSAETAAWNSYLSNTFALQNPTWWNDFQSEDKKTAQHDAQKDLIAIFQNGAAPPGEQSGQIQDLLHSWDTHQAALSAGKAQGWTKEERDAELTAWTTYTNGLIADNPWMSMIVHRAFKDSYGTYVGN